MRAVALLTFLVALAVPVLPATAQWSTEGGARSGTATGRHLGGSVGGFVGGVTGAAVGTAGGLVRAVTSPFRSHHAPRRQRRRAQGQ